MQRDISPNTRASYVKLFNTCAEAVLQGVRSLRSCEGDAELAKGYKRVIVKVKCAILLLVRRRGAHLPS